MRTLAALLLVGTAMGLAACGGGPPSEPTAPPARRSAGPPPSAGAPPPAPIKVRVLAFNDFHGNLKPPTGRVPKVNAEVGGAAWFAAHLKRLGAGQPSIIVAAGDLVGASPLTSALFHDEPTVDVMNAMGLAVTSLGNHEFDEGLDEILRLKKGGCHPKDGCKYTPAFSGEKYDVLGANVTVSATGSAPLPAYVIREVGGVPIAFVGMTLQDTPHAVLPENVAGIAFGEEAKTANALVPEIRARGVETMILLIHEGGEVNNPGLDECNDFRGSIVKVAEKLDPAFDAIVSGHTHALYNCRVGGRPVTSALSFGRVITSIDLTIDPKTKDVTASEVHNHAVTHDIPADPTVQAIIDRASTAAAALENRPIGRITETLAAGGRGGTESVLGNVIADAQLEATKKQGAKVALVNSAGVRADIVFAKSGDEKEDGIVTYGEAFAAQPFGNPVVSITIPARELAGVIEREGKDGSGLLVSEGLSVRLVTEDGKKRVGEIKLNGKPLDLKGTIRITTNSFVAGRDPALKEGTNRVVGVGDIEALEAYFAAHPRVSPPKTRRILRN